jgi:hypothetical protein
MAQRLQALHCKKAASSASRAAFALFVIFEHITRYYLFVANKDDPHNP